MKDSVDAGLCFVNFVDETIDKSKWYSDMARLTAASVAAEK